MGSDHLKGGKLAARCCHGVCFGIGFLLVALFFSVMFWIVWCYLGLSIVQVSETQRRGAPVYSFPTTAAPPNRTEAPTFESSANTISRSATASTTAARVQGRGETSPLTSNRGKSSDRLQVTTLAKGDFSGRNRANATGRTTEGVRNLQSQGASTAPPRLEDETKSASILTGFEDDGIQPRRVATSAGENLPQEDVGKTPDSRLTVDALLPQTDIKPTQAYDYVDKDIRPSKEDKIPPSDYPDSGLRGLPRRGDIQSSRRHTDTDASFRDPDFERDYPRSVSRDRSRYDEDDDVRGSRGRYDKRDRGRNTDDRLSKGDTRVFPDDIDRRSRPDEDRDRKPVYVDRDRDIRPMDEDRDRDRRPLYEDRDRDGRPIYADRDRDRRPVYEDRDRPIYEDRERDRKVDDGRDRDRRPVYEDRDRDRRPIYDDRDRDRKPVDDDRDRDRKPVDDDRDRDRRPVYEDRDRDIRPVYEARDRDRRPVYEDRDLPRDRYDEKRRDDDKRLRDRDGIYEDNPRTRDSDRSRTDLRPDDKERTREDRNRPVESRRPVDRDDEYSYRSRDDRGRYRDRDQDDRRKVDRVDEYLYRPRDDEERRRDDSRRGDTGYSYPVSDSRSSDLPSVDRRPVSGRQNSSNDERPYTSSDRDRSKTYDPVESRSRTSVDDRYRDSDYRKPPLPYDDRDRIAPTRVRDESKSSPLVSRDDAYDSRPSDDRPRDRVPSRTYDRYPPEEERRYLDDRVRETRYYDDDDRKTGNSRLISPSSVAESGNSKRPLDDREYRTRNPDSREYRTRLPDDRDYRTRTSDDREYRTRLPEERKSDDKYAKRRDDEVVLESRSYASDEVDESPRGNSRTRPSYDGYQDDDKYVRRIRPGDEEYVRRIRPGDEEYVRKSRPDDDGYRRTGPRGDYDTDRPRYREGYDDDRSVSRKYDRPVDDQTTRRDLDDISSRKESNTRDSFTESRDHRYHPEDRPLRDDDHRYSPRSDEVRSALPKTTRRDPFAGLPSVEDKEVRPLSAQDVIEAAQRHADIPEQSSRKVFYPVFDPRASNLTSPELIRPSERRGITIGSRRRRRTLKVIL